MIEICGRWTQEDTDIYLKTHPNKFIVEKKRVFVYDIGDAIHERK